MKNKKGFTLVELLAVIAILAILVILAIPNVISMVEKSRKSLAETSAKSLISTAKNYYIKSEMNGKNAEEIDLTDPDFEYTGERVTKGKLTMNKDGSSYGKIYIRGYCISIKSNGNVSSEKVDAENCNLSPEMITFTINGNSFKVEEGTTLENFLKNLDENQGLTVIKDSITQYYFKDYDGAIIIGDNNTNKIMDLKNRKISADDAYTTLYVSITKNFSWDDIASDNYVPILYRYTYNNTTSATMAVICSKNDVFADVADAVYPVQILYFLGVNYEYIDLNKVSSYSGREIVNDYIIGYKAGLKYHKSNNDAVSDFHVFEEFMDSQGNKIKLSDKVTTKSLGLITGKYHIISKDTSFEDAKKEVINNLSK